MNFNKNKDRSVDLEKQVENLQEQNLILKQKTEVQQQSIGDQLDQINQLRIEQTKVCKNLMNKVKSLEFFNQDQSESMLENELQYKQITIMIEKIIEQFNQECTKKDQLISQQSDNIQNTQEETIQNKQTIETLSQEIQLLQEEIQNVNEDKSNLINQSNQEKTNLQNIMQLINPIKSQLSSRVQSRINSELNSPRNQKSMNLTVFSNAVNLENSNDMIQRIHFYMKKFIDKDKNNTLKIFDLENQVNQLDQTLEQKLDEIKDYQDLVDQLKLAKNPSQSESKSIQQAIKYLDDQLKKKDNLIKLQKENIDLLQKNQRKNDCNYQLYPESPKYKFDKSHLSYSNFVVINLNRIKKVLPNVKEKSSLFLLKE